MKRCAKCFGTNTEVVTIGAYEYGRKCDHKPLDQPELFQEEKPDASTV